MKAFLSAAAILGLWAFCLAQGGTGADLAKPPAPAASPAPLWDGNETIIDYARRAGIAQTQPVLDLDGNVTLKLTLVPAGKFLMGSPATDPNRWPDEGPRHEVTISKPFYMGACEVTQGQVQKVLGRNPSRSATATRPVDSAGWADADEFCKKLSQKTGRTVRLPTEAEWEYACRAGSAARYCYGDSGEPNRLGEYAWFADNTNKVRTQPVGGRKPNAWGLYDMHGNVWEWCSDFYADSYPKEPVVDPQGPAEGLYRVLRGGSFEDEAGFCRSTYRNRYAADVQIYGMGFRVVMELGSGAPVAATRPGSP